MNPTTLDKLKQPLLWLGIAGVVKLISQTFFNVSIGTDQINAAANGIAAMFTIVGVFMDHSKPAPTDPATPIQNQTKG